MNRFPISHVVPIIITVTFACADPPHDRGHESVQEDWIEPIPVEDPVPIPLPRLLGPARLLRRASLALTGLYPTAADLELAAAGQLDVPARIEAMLGTQAFLNQSSGWVLQWMQLETAYRALRDGYLASVPSGFAYELQYWGVDADYYGPWAVNPFFLTPATEEFVHRAAAHTASEIPLTWRRIVRDDLDFRELLTSNDSIRSVTLERAYALRDWAPEEPPLRDVTTFPVFDPSGEDELEHALGETFYVVPKGPDRLPGLNRGKSGILSSMAYLNTRINGRTRTNGVVQAFLCREIPAVQPEAYVPPGCEPSTSPECIFYRHPGEGCKKCHITLDPMARLWMRFHGSDWPSDVFYDDNLDEYDPTACDGQPCRPNPTGGDIKRTYAHELGDPPSSNVRLGLAQKIVDDPSFPKCIVSRTFEVMVGRKLQPIDHVLQQQLVDVFTENWSFKDLLRAVMATNEFRYE